MSKAAEVMHQRDSEVELIESEPHDKRKTRINIT